MEGRKPEEFKVKCFLLFRFGVSPEKRNINNHACSLASLRFLAFLRLQSFVVCLFPPKKNIFFAPSFCFTFLFPQFWWLPYASFFFAFLNATKKKKVTQFLSFFFASLKLRGLSPLLRFLEEEVMLMMMSGRDVAIIIITSLAFSVARRFIKDEFVTFQFYSSFSHP